MHSKQLKENEDLRTHLATMEVLLARVAAQGNSPASRASAPKVVKCA